MEEAHKVRRDMKVRKYGSGGGGSIEWVKCSIDVNRNGGARGAGMGSSARRSTRDTISISSLFSFHCAPVHYFHARAAMITSGTMKHEDGK